MSGRFDQLKAIKIRLSLCAHNTTMQEQLQQAVTSSQSFKGRPASFFTMEVIKGSNRDPTGQDRSPSKSQIIFVQQNFPQVGQNIGEIIIKLLELEADARDFEASKAKSGDAADPSKKRFQVRKMSANSLHELIFNMIVIGAKIHFKMQLFGSGYYASRRRAYQLKIYGNNAQQHLATLQWFFITLRVKTIFFERCERDGITDRQSRMDKTSFSDDQNYLSAFQERKSEPGLVDEVYEKLRDELTTDKSYQDKNHKSYQRINFERFFVDNFSVYGSYEEDGGGRVHLPLSSDGRSLVLKMISMPLENVKDFVFRDIRVSRQFLGQLLRRCKLSEHNKVEKLFFTLQEVFRGYFGEQKYTKVVSGQLCFQHAQAMHWPETNHIFLFRVMPRRVAIFEKNGSSDLFTGFAYYQKLEFVNWATKGSNEHYRQKGTNEYYSNVFADMRYTGAESWANCFSRQTSQRIQTLLNRQHESDKVKACLNPNQWEAFLANNVLTDLPPLQRHSVSMKINNVFKISYDQTRQQDRFMPLDFEDRFFTDEIAMRFQRHPRFGEFFYADEFKIIEDKFRRADAGIVEQVSDEQGAQQLLKLIKAIPKIKFNLTKEQELMISTPQNLLCLGRSGTGKTTSSALRLFATDAYYKYHEQLAKFKLENPDKKNKDFHIEPSFIDQNSKLKLTFVSASPVLVNEIRRFYTDFKKHFGLELEKVQAKRLGKPVVAEQEHDPSAVTQEGAKEEDSEKKALEEYIQNELQEIEQDEQIQKGMLMAESMEELSSEDFPLFLTVKRLIYMLDASTDFPFFSRDKTGKQIGLESNVEWHNEQGGVYMINQYHKSQANYDGMVKELGQKLVDLADGTFDEAEGHQNAADLDDGQEESKTTGKDKPFQQESGQNLMNLISVVDSEQSKVFSLRSQNLSFEVDYNIFETRFWPRVRHLTKLSPIVIWTEICSEIKGRVDSYKFEDFGININGYMAGTGKKKGNFMEVEEKYEVYMIWIRYEQWKNEMRAYDLNDVVNHVLQQIRSDILKETCMIHFLMVDEVQDLTQNVISLLMNLAQKNIFFSGDTAQTIAKGVGFRFYDLKQVFSRNNYDMAFQQSFQVPKVLQLTKNFRSHSKILDMANSVVSLLELCFPQTIDKLMKETSDLEGPKPIIVDQCSPEQLGVLLGQLQIWGGGSKDEQASQQKPEESKDKVQQQQFGCDRVVIVRDQESKAYLPTFMRNMLCLTVYECKGLEFDEVILFNFFQDSKCHLQWKLINDVSAEQKVTKIHANDDFLDFEMLEVPEGQIVAEASKEESKTHMIDTSEEKKEVTTDGVAQSTRVDGDHEITTVLSLNTKRQEVYRKFAKVCTELKLLYVAITRPKTLLIIYDQDNSVRMPIQNYWEATKVADVIRSNQVSDPALLPEHIQKTLKLNFSVMEPGESVDPVELGLKWRLQGFKLFKVKFYQAAIQCFRNSGDVDLVKRCEAYEHADEATGLQSQCEQKISMYTDKTNFLKKHDRLEYKREAKVLREASKQKMRKAGHIFNEINLNKHAAQCFFSSGDQEGAAKVFFKLRKYGQAAECYHSLGQIRKAANLYAKAELFANAFECYEELQDWDGLLQCMHKYREKFSEADNKNFINKYVPIALNSLYQLYTNLDPEGANNLGVMTEDNKGKVQQMRLRLKFQRSVSIIREEQEIDDDEDVEDDDDDEVQSGSEKSEKGQNHQVDNKDKAALPQEETKEPSLVMINTGDSGEGQQPEESFDVIGSDEADEAQANDQDQAYVNIDSRDLELEILSNIDPQDEFLQSEKSFSLIDDVSQNDHDFSIISSQHSEFSIISGSKIHQVLNNSLAKSAQIDLSSLDLEDGSSDAAISQLAPSEDSALRQYMNSNRFSVIDCTGDMYAEDVVIQKVIYYISLFQKEVYNYIKGDNQAAGKDDLADVIDEVADAEVTVEQFEEDIEKAAFDEDMEFMMIELDSIKPEVLAMILDTLERFELYRLSLILCNRYDMRERNGRFVAAISQKYSNLGQMRHSSFLKFFGQPHLQSRFSLIAQEAMHNVLSLAGQGQVERSISFRDQCFDSLFLQGFWKKLVFILDPDSSLQLCFAMQDFQSFRLNFLVEKLGVTEPVAIKKGVEDQKEFSELLIAQNYPGIATDKEFQKEFLSKPSLESLAIELEQLIWIQGSPSSIKAEKEWNTAMVRQLLQEGGALTPAKARLCSRLSAAHAVDKNSSTTALNYGSPKFMSHAINCLIEMLKVPQDCYEMQRAIYQPFGVSWIEGLDAFESISSSYCLVKRTCNLMNEVRQYHECSLDSERATILAEKYQELKTYGVRHNVFMDAITKHYTDTIKKFMSSENQRFDIEVAFPCDIDLEWYLVPKAWVREIVQRYLVKFAIDQIVGQASLMDPRYNKVSQSVLLKLEQQCRKLIFVLSNSINKHSALGETENLIKERSSGIINFGSLFNQVVQRPLRVIKSIHASALVQVKKKHAQIVQFMHERETIVMATDYRIRKVPKFQVFGPTNVDTGVIALAMAKAFEGLAVIASTRFYPSMLQAFQQFVSCDSYPIFVELLTKRKESSQGDQNAVKKINTVFHLLDAHVYAKVGETEQECKSLLAFLRTAFQDITTNQLAQLIATIFYKSMFALSIFTYKQTHQGVKIPLEGYANIEPDQEEVGKIDLPEIYVKQGNFSQVKLALNWMQNLLTGLAQGEERDTHKRLFIKGHAMVDCVIRNLASEQIFELRESISEISKFQYEQSPIHDLTKLQFCKKATEVKAITKKLSTTSEQVYKIVTVGLTDPKRISQHYKVKISNRIDKELDRAGIIEGEILSRRKEAASKIYTFWLAKSQDMQEKREIKKAIQQSMAAEQQNEDAAARLLAGDKKYYVTQQNHSSRQFNLAKACADQLVRAMHLTDTLLTKIIGIMGSDLIKGAVDQKFVLEKMKDLTEKRQAILNFIRECPKIADQAKYLRGLVTELVERVGKIEGEVTKWFENQSNELASVERSKHRYIKLEKWNTVIQQRTRKLKLKKLQNKLKK